MCGIIGINEKDEKLILDSGEGFKYRGPDATAFFSDDFVTLGHHRLAIVDLDTRSSQPMSDDSGKIWIVFNGEIYNFKAVKERLANTYQFKTTSDTEVLIYAYKEWGLKMTEHVKGMFALAIYDQEAQKIILLRDHAGIKPLCYYAKDGVFVFASEIKGVLKALNLKNIFPKIDHKMVDLYFTLGYLPTPYTLYENVHKLPKRSYLEYDLRTKTVTRQGQYQAVYNRVVNSEEYIKLIEQKILDHLIADVPVGVFFSGGTDSSLIVAVLHKYKINLETFSIKINYKSDDARHFSEISKLLELKYHVFDFDVAELDQIYEEVMTKIDEPSFDNSIFPTYFVSKKAAGKVKVVLSGEGGDEIFYGYPRSQILYRLNKYPDYRVSFFDYLYLWLPAFKAKNRLFEKLFLLLKKPISYLLVSGVSRDRATIAQWRQLKGELRARRLKPLQFDQELYLENDLLRKIDFATSYTSIEGRVPLLDVDIMNNSGVVEDEKLAGGVLKAFLKKMLARYLPAESVYRSKSGFGVDIGGLFKQSQFLGHDLAKALVFLEENKIYRVGNKNIDFLIRKYPHLCFAIVSLYRSILNNKN